MDQITENLKKYFEPELVELIQTIGTFQKVPEGKVILDYGQPIRHIPMILKGTIKVLRLNEEGKELLLYFIHPMESCAMTFTCCMQEYPSEVKAVAESPVEFLVFPVHVMDEWLFKFPTWKSFVMKTIRNRFTELLNTLDQVAFQKMDERLENYLKARSEVSGSSVINATHEEIAQDLATSRVVISRLLKKMENDERIILYRNQIKLLNKF